MTKRVKYYCGKCARKHGWDFGGFLMETTCDVCGKLKDCQEFSTPREIK